MTQDSITIKLSFKVFAVFPCFRKDEAWKYCVLVLFFISSITTCWLDILCICANCNVFTVDQEQEYELRDKSTTDNLVPDIDNIETVECDELDCYCTQTSVQQQQTRAALHSSTRRGSRLGPGGHRPP